LFTFICVEVRNEALRFKDSSQPFLGERSWQLYSWDVKTWPPNRQLMVHKLNSHHTYDLGTAELRLHCSNGARCWPNSCRRQLDEEGINKGLQACFKLMFNSSA